MSEYCEINKCFEKLAAFKRRQLIGLLEDEKLHVAQFPALKFIIEHGGCTQVELAEFLYVTPASVAVSTKRMERAGLIEKREDKNNLRQKNLFITDKGTEAVNECKAIFDRFDEQMYAGISFEELDLLKNVLEKILMNIKKEELYAKNISKTHERQRPPVRHCHAAAHRRRGGHGDHHTDDNGKIS